MSLGKKFIGIGLLLFVMAAIFLLISLNKPSLAGIGEYILFLICLILGTVILLSGLVFNLLKRFDSKVKNHDNNPSYYYLKMVLFLTISIGAFLAAKYGIDNDFHIGNFWWIFTH